jgi:5'(3')-deoxyribonucleotidase
MSKLKVGIDLDMVLNTLNCKWVRQYNETYNDNLTLEDIKSWGIEEYVKPECGMDIFKILAIPGFFKDLEVQPNSQEIVEWLQENYEIYVLSASHYAVCGDKGSWLQEKFPFIPYHNIIFCHNKSLVHLDYLIDDYGKNLETFTGQGLLFDSHHNQAENRFPRMKDWLEVKEYFEKELLL